MRLLFDVKEISSEHSIKKSIELIKQTKRVNIFFFVFALGVDIPEHFCRTEMPADRDSGLSGVHCLMHVAD